MKPRGRYESANDANGAPLVAAAGLPAAVRTVAAARAQGFSFVRATQPARREIIHAIRAERLARRIEALAVTAATPKFGCLMAMLPSLDSDLPYWASENIPADKLTADGIEMEPHATVLYGFALNFNTAKLRAALAGFGPVRLKLGEVSRFECPEYDVLKFSVDSPDLHRLNALVAETFDAEITKSKWVTGTGYKPHVTIAYVAKGSCRGFDGGADKFTGREFVVTELLYSLPNEQGREMISLTDRVTAATPAGIQSKSEIESHLRGHGHARDEAAKVYRRALSRAVAVAETSAIASLTSEQDREAQERHRDEALAAIALLLLLAGRTAYKTVFTNLPQPLAAGGLHTTPVEPFPTPLGAFNPDDAAAFAAGRASLLTHFPKAVFEKLDAEIGVGQASGWSNEQILEAIHQTASDLEAGYAETVAQTEAQATYGDAQRKLLQHAGFITKIWMTCEDDKVRPTHVECGEQGELPLGQSFSNGLQYPGDPNGGPEEVINCRCWLVGGRRSQQPQFDWNAPGVPVKSSYQQMWNQWREELHPRDHGQFASKSDAATFSFHRPAHKSKHSRAIQKALEQLSTYDTPLPRPVAGAIIVNEAGKILLGRSSFGGQGWFFPKGGQDEGETVEQAAAREAVEETGVAVGEPLTQTPIPIYSNETYGDSLGFGSPRHQHKDPSLPIAAGAAQAIARAAAVAGLTPEELAEHRDTIFDDLAGNTFVRWDSKPNYHLYAVRGEPGHATDEVEEVRWVTPSEARALPTLHSHAAELVNHPFFDELIASASTYAPEAVQAADHSKFHGNQYVDVPAVTQAMQDAIQHFKLVQDGTLPLNQTTAGHLLQSRAAFKSVPADHAKKATLQKLGEQVVAEGLKAGVKYQGGGQVSFKPQYKQNPAPGFDLSAIKLKPAVLAPKTNKSAANQAPGAAIAGFEDSWATPLTAAGKKLNEMRVAKAEQLLTDGTATPDAVLQVLAPSDPDKLAFVKAITTGPGAERALTEFKDTPRGDLEVLSSIDVTDKPLAGQAVCYMQTRKIGMGSTSVTGDFRHELGHAIHAAIMHSGLDNHIQALHVATLKKVKENPAGLQTKLTHEFYETTYGVIGRRALDNDKENVAEHYRGYHKAVYRTRTGEDPTALATYKERFPGWAQLWDAWYSAQLPNP